MGGTGKDASKHSDHEISKDGGLVPHGGAAAAASVENIENISHGDRGIAATASVAASAALTAPMKSSGVGVEALDDDELNQEDLEELSPETKSKCLEHQAEAEEAGGGGSAI